MKTALTREEKESIVTGEIALTTVLAICAIAIVVVAFASKNNRNVQYLSVAGIFVSLMSSACIKAIEAPFANDVVTFETLTGSGWAFLLGDITEVSLLSSFWVIPAIFAGIILWTFLYNATLPEKEKLERKLMLGEAD